ncbi:hypothetical protein LCGC14_1295100 [marine sediment metagenome]|uniref:Uncharacterized protein n=1 Tax=marine sediment metagenome TaxID=412755 RepID=A0A0F9LC58_9ZZZZ
MNKTILGEVVMTIWNWLLVIGCVLLWIGCALLIGQLTSEWKQMEYDAAKRECQRKWGVDTW